MQIPTSRDINRQSTRSGRISPDAPRGGIGQALANVGQGLSEVAYNLNDLRTQEQNELNRKAGFDLETKIAQFRDEEEKAFNAARDNASESGIGFTRQFMEGYEGRVNDFIKNNFTGVTEAQDAASRQTLLGLGNSLYGKSYGYEQQAKTNFYDRTTNQGLDSVRTQIRNNAAPYEELKRQGLAAIDAADMPEAWKAERRALWDADAAESKWRWKFESDPKAALSDLKAPAGSRVGQAYQRLVSKGWAPHQAAGIVGNLQAESGVSLNTQARNAGDGTDGSDSIGIAQWNGKRAQALKAFAAERGADWHDFNTQIDFIDHELRTTERAAGENLARSANAEEAAAAFTGYERPAGWSAGNARGSHNWTGRRDNALRIAGENPQAEDADLDAISYDRREQLASWGETQYSQQVNKERAAAKDRYSLLIATEPQNVSQSVILRDQSLDNGDKATLINSLNSAMKDRGATDALIGAIAAGSVSVNPFNNDQTKIADKAYERMASAAGSAQDQQVVTSDFIARTGYIPQPVQAELRRGSASTNPAEVAQAMEAASVFQKNAPVSFGAFDGSSGVSKNLDLYKTYTGAMGYTADEAAKKIISSNDPEQIRRRDAILKSEPIKKVLKDTDADDVAAIFKGGFFSRSPDVGASVGADEIKVGVNPESEAAIVADYRSVLEEALVDANGDQAAAQDIAKRRFQTIYGTTNYSPLAGNIVVRYPPEKAYPAMPDGSHDYIREQLAEAMKAEGVEASAFYLQGDADTEKDIKAGKPARYQVFYEQDGKLQRYNLPFYADPDAAKAQIKEKQAQTVKEAEQRMLEKRAEQQRRFPDGEGLGQVERFGNDQLYRGIAREGSPMARAQRDAADKRNAAAERGRQGRAKDDADQRAWEALSPEEQRQRSQDSFLDGPGPFQKQGMQ